ncbi:MAG: adhesin HecA family, partial [uncultured bacterium]
VNHRVLGDNGYLAAITDSGNIDIISKKSIGKAGNISLTAIANSGNVNICADGSIYQSGTGLAVKGERIDLVSNYGSIGSSNGSLLIHGGQIPRVSGDTMSASVNARALGGIYLKQDSGDMRLGHVESVTGDVTLRVNTGDFYDALPVGEAIKGNSAEELIAKWVKLGIISADGSDNAASKKAVAVRNYEDGVKSQFASYQSQKKIYEKNPGLNRAASYLALHAMFSGYASAEACLAAMSADRNSDYYKLSSNTYGWTRDNLLYALQSSIINKTGGSSQTTVKGVNVKGKNITLSAGHGIGRDEGKEEVDLTRLNETATLKKLAAAEASDIKWGVDKSGNENKQIATVNKTNAIGIEMCEGGLLTADAQQNVYIAGATDDPIYLNNVSGQNIRLLGKNGIYNVNFQENDGNSNINGIDLIIEGGSSQIGTVDKPVYINTLGKVTARADGLINIYHKNGSNPLQISAIYGGANVLLRALNGILSVNTGIPSEDLGYINAAGLLSLQSFKGNIGEATKGLRILADNTDAVNAVASNIYLAAESQSSAKPPLNMGNINVGNGTFKVTSDRTGVNFTGSVNAHDVFIKTDSVSQTGDNGYIHADILYAETRNGMSLNSTRNQVPVVSFSGTGSGNVAYTGSVPDLQLNGISNLNGDVSINNQQGNVNIIESINARNLFINAAQGLISQTNSCEITAANLNAVTLNGMSLAGFISRATLSNSGSGNIRLLNFSDLVLDSVTNRVSGGNVEIICRNINQNINSISRGSIESAGEVNITCDHMVNVTSIKTANNLNINCFGGITSDHIESLNGNVNLIANGSGDINVHELLGRKIQALMQDGNIFLGYLKGYSAFLGSKSRDGLILVDKAEVSGSIDAKAAHVSIDSILHKSDAKKLQLNFAGANSGCMDSVFIDNIYSDTGVQMNGLWTNTADIQTNHSDFTLSDVYVVDRGYLSNGKVSMTVFGQNPVQDKSHIQIYFAPKEAGNFTDISFQNILGGFEIDDYTIIHFADEVSWLFNQLSWVDEVSFTVNSTLKAVSLAGRPLTQPDKMLHHNEFAYTTAEIVNLAGTNNWTNNIAIQNGSIVTLDVNAAGNGINKMSAEEDPDVGSETEAED